MGPNHGNGVEYFGTTLCGHTVDARIVVLGVNALTTGVMLQFIISQRYHCKARSEPAIFSFLTAPNFSAICGSNNLIISP